MINRSSSQRGGNHIHGSLKARAHCPCTDDDWKIVGYSVGGIAGLLGLRQLLTPKWLLWYTDMCLACSRRRQLEVELEAGADHPEPGQHSGIQLEHYSSPPPLPEIGWHNGYGHIPIVEQSKLIVATRQPIARPAQAQLADSRYGAPLSMF